MERPGEGIYWLLGFEYRKIKIITARDMTNKEKHFIRAKNEGAEVRI